MRKLSIWLCIAAVAGLASEWIWERAIHGDWDAQSQAAADLAYGMLAISIGLGLAALVAAIWSRSWRLMIGVLLVAALIVVYGTAGAFGISFSRSPGGFGLM